MANSTSVYRGSGPLERAIYRTLAYSSLSEYPLTLPEIHRGLAGYRTYRRAVEDALAEGEPLRRHVGEVEGHYHLPGQEGWVALRRERRARSLRFLEEHRGILGGLCALPWVRGVAVSGATAFHNLRKEDEDLDVFLVAEPGRLWLALSAVWAYRRRAGGMLCINYVIAGDALALPYPNAYNAHQLLSLRPISGVETFRELWEANPWTQDFFPNWTAGAELTDSPWSEGMGGGPPLVRSLARARLRVPSPVRDAVEARLDAAVYTRYRRRLEGMGRPGNTQTETYDRAIFKRHPNDHRVPLTTRLAAVLREAGWPEDELPTAS